MPPLHTLVRDHVQHRRNTPALFAEILAATRLLLSRYPDAWHAGGARGEEAVLDLADRVFFVCDRVAKNRFPFLGRVPFPCYVAEDFDTPLIQRHTFKARLSIAREIMNEDYAAATTRDARLAWRNELYHQIGQHLRVVAEPVTTRPKGAHTNARTVWRLLSPPSSPPGPRLVPTADKLLAALRAKRDAGMPALVETALAALGSCTQAHLADLLAEVLPPPAPLSPGDMEVGMELRDDDEAPEPVRLTPPDDPYARLKVREAVLDGYQRLSPEERHLLEQVAEGLTYDEIIARSPQLRDEPTLSRRLASINATLKERVALAFGVPVDARWGQRELAERLFDVLMLCLPGEAEEESP